MEIYEAPACVPLRPLVLGIERSRAHSSLLPTASRANPPERTLLEPGGRHRTLERFQGGVEGGVFLFFLYSRSEVLKFQGPAERRVAAAD